MAPKQAGGLGVGDAVIRNTALLFKWWWRFSKEDCPLWKQVVCSCNNMNPTVMLQGQPAPIRGGPWRDICQLQISESQLREKMISGLSMELGNGRTIRFWEDSWLPPGVLKDMFPRLFSVSTLQGSVIGDCGFWDGLVWIWSFQWRRELFQWELDLVHQLHELLQSVKPTNGKEDGVVWKFDKTGVYSTASFGKVLQAEVLPEEITSYSFTSAVWKGLVPPRVELFTWFVLVGRVNTKDRLCRFRVIPQHDNRCVLCDKAEENVFHLFLECETTWKVWCAWLLALGRQWSLPGTLKDHFESWTKLSIRKVDRKRWFIGFFAVIWTTWLERNGRLFRDHTSSMEDIINRSFRYSEEWSGVDPFGC
ncbi:uncharacterized protein LOC110266736 [Arachis ipaensis]|uniref:uncharacterized protein LOC110266736 n=1 Tax=Arachis ipaensis TaxID=130454 RepID=UPI000A2B2568|nr:uncharacterized protein LOC110266736 [Arachis ipaensis]